jgi:hypothetical protein
MDGEVVTVVFLGPARWILALPGSNPPTLLHHFTGLFINSLWSLLQVLSLYQYGPQFVYRYLLVCHDWRMHFPVYVACALTAPLVLNVWFVIVNAVPAEDPLRVRNLATAIALGIDLPLPEGFAIRTRVG